MDSKLREILTDDLIAEVKDIKPTEREAQLLKSLDESDITKFTPEEKAVEEETPIEETPVEEAPVEEAPVEEVPAEEPAPEEEPVKEEEPVAEEEKTEPVVVAINDDLSDGKRPDEETSPKEDDKGEPGKPEVVAVNNLDEEPAEEEPEPEEAPTEEPAPEEEPVEEAPAEEEKVEEKPAEEPVSEEEKPAEEADDEPREGETPEEAEARRKLKIRGSISEAVGEAGTSKVPGKFEVFPEDDEFKYRLKANNGEILVVSYGYTTREGAHAGIDTLKKNLESGVVAYITDKNGRSQWRLSTGNDARIVALGETYSSLASAQSAFASTQKFGKADRIIDLDEIPAKERRTWEFTAEVEDEKDSGTIEIYDDNGKFRARLLANNQEVLFVTAQSYSSKASLKSSLENIKEKLGPKAFHLSKDKQDRYQFIMESGSGFVYLVGESYSAGATAKSAAGSVLAFINKAEVVDLTLKSANVDVELTGTKKED